MANRFSNLLDDDGNCHIYGLLPSKPIPSRFIYGNALAIQLAVKHLNEGNGKFVSEINGLNHSCPIRFSASILDTNFSPEDAFEVVDKVTSIGGCSKPVRKPCGFVGAVASSVSQSTAQITGLRGIPQVSPASTNVELELRSIYKHFARVVPSDAAMAEYLVRFLYEQLKARHLFVIVEDDPFTKSVMKSLRAAIFRLGLSPSQRSSTTAMYVEERVIKAYDSNDNSDGLLYEALEALEKSDYRFVLNLATNTDHAVHVMEAAHNASLVGTSNDKGIYNWWFYETMNLSDKTYKPNDPLAKAFDGVGYIHQSWENNEVARRYYEESMALKKEFYQRNNATDRIAIDDWLLPVDWKGGFLNESEWFTSLEDRFLFDRFSYDATILLGLSACREIVAGKQKEDVCTDTITDSMVCEYGNICDCETFVDAPESTGCDGVYSSIMGDIEVNSLCREYCGCPRMDDIKSNAAQELVLEGENFYNRILNSNFTGVTGKIVLDSETGTRRGDSVKYDIDNWRAYEEELIVTEEDDEGRIVNRTELIVRFNRTNTYILEPGGKEWQNVHPHFFNGGKNLSALGSTPDLAPVDVTYGLVAPWVQGLGFGFLGIILLMAAIFVLWTIKNWNTRVVRASQPHFLLMICLGIIIMALSLYPISMIHTKEQVIDTYQMMQTEEQPEDAYPVFLCTSVWYFIMIGFGITFSTLFAKTYRINQIIANSMKCKRIQLSIQETLYPVAAITIFNIIMLVLMTTLRPVYYAIVQENDDRFGRPTEIYGNCKFTSDGDKKGALPFLLPTIAVNFIMVFLGLSQTWRARNLSTEFSESRYIGVVLLISLLVAMFAIPILILTQGNPNVDTFVRLMLASIIPGTTLLFIFIPKMIVHAKSKQAGCEEGQEIFVRRASFTMRTYGSSVPGSGHQENVRESSREAPIDGSGEKIVTAKTHKQLASEITSLEQVVEEYRSLNQKLQDRNTLLERRLRAGDDNKLESTVEIESNRSFVFQSNLESVAKTESVGSFISVSSGGEAEA